MKERVGLLEALKDMTAVFEELTDSFKLANLKTQDLQADLADPWSAFCTFRTNCRTIVSARVLVQAVLVKDTDRRPALRPRAPHVALPASESHSPTRSQDDQR